MAYRHPEAETHAQAVLETLGVTDPPVDPIALARQLNIQVWISDLDNDVAGLLVKNDQERPEIYLNRFDATVRQRFTCAHEIGHYYKRSLSPDKKRWNYVDRRDDLSSRGTDPSERYANAFAAAFLMPEEMVRRVSSTGLSERAMARVFGVSDIAMRYRLENLSLRG